MQSVKSRHNSRIKLLRALIASGRERRRQMLSVLDGPHLINAFLDTGRVPRFVAVANDDRGKREIRAIVDRVGDANTVAVSSAVFKSVTPVDSPTGIVAVVDVPESSFDPSMAECLVMLDGIQDPGNVGTIIRTSAAAGADGILLSAGCADPWSPRVLRAGMGANFVMPVNHGADLVSATKEFRGRVIAVASRGGRWPSAIDLAGPIVFVFGSEGAGISEAVARHADETVTVPMNMRIESLNVAAAAAVVMFERVRQLMGRGGDGT